MAIICPAILAASEEEYRQQIERVAKFAHRIQIDLTDGKFAPSKTISPEQIWWPVGVLADFHLMYRDPSTIVKAILEHQPNMIIVHAEAEGDFQAVARLCHTGDVKVGIALLQDTFPETILPALEMIDHVLIFSGNLGSYGGQADTSLLEKVRVLKGHKPGLEVGWDGGVNDQNAAELILGGVDVLNVGGFMQNSDNPPKTYAALQRIANETGST